MGIVALLVAVCVVLYHLRGLLPVDVLKLGLSMLQVCDAVTVDVRIATWFALERMLRRACDTG